MWVMCVSDSGQLEQKLEEATSARREMEGSSKHIRSLEKQMKSLNLERDDLHKVGVCVSVCVCVCRCDSSLGLDTVLG
jgi:hypothetical protein